MSDNLFILYQTEFCLNYVQKRIKQEKYRMEDQPLYHGLKVEELWGLWKVAAHHASAALL